MTIKYHVTIGDIRINVEVDSEYELQQTSGFVSIANHVARKTIRSAGAARLCCNQSDAVAIADTGLTKVCDMTICKDNNPCAYYFRSVVYLDTLDNKSDYDVLIARYTKFDGGGDGEIEWMGRDNWQTLQQLVAGEVHWQVDLACDIIDFDNVSEVWQKLLESETEV